MPAPTYRNPVLPGFAADPSVCRVGRDYFLVNSSFEFFPGLPIHHSRNLVHWRLIGHALTREGQLPLHGRGSSRGLFAPTLRWHQGRFHLVCTDVDGRGSFLLQADDAAGPWSDPIWLDEPVFGMDPSLFFDDDGLVYYTRHGGGERGGVDQALLAWPEARLQGPVRRIWGGTGGIWPEGPHLQRRGDWYFLLIAEGGTSYGHAITVARSRSPWGPFEPYPDNPVLTHRGRPDQPLQALGHADWVDTPDGATWAVLLGVRAQHGDDGPHHHLGRETLLARVHWRADGWPVFNRGQPLGLQESGEGLPPAAPWPAEPALERFDATRGLPLHWQTLRGPLGPRLSLNARPGWLRLQAGAPTLAQGGTPSALLRPQRHLALTLDTALELHARNDSARAGLVLRQSEDHHLRLQRRHAGAAGWVEVVWRHGGSEHTLARAPCPPGPLALRIVARPRTWTLAWRPVADAHAALADADTANAPWRPLAVLPTRALSTETTGGFLGVHLGLFVEDPALAQALATPATRRAQADAVGPAHADFAGLRLQPEPDDAPEPPAPPQSRA